MVYNHRLLISDALLAHAAERVSARKLQAVQRLDLGRMLTVVRNLLKQTIIVDKVVLLEDVAVLVVEDDLLAGLVLQHEVVNEALIIGTVGRSVLVAVRLAENLLEKIAAHRDDHAWFGRVVRALEYVKHRREEVVALHFL